MEKYAWRPEKRRIPRMVETSVLTPEATVRLCPICGAGGKASLFADSNIEPDLLNQFAFASRKLPEYMHWRLWECGQCDLLYANPAPAVEQLAGLYRDAAFGSGTEARWAAKTYGGLLKRIVPQLPDRVGALDIGTGDGAFLHELLDQGFSSVVGIEPSSAPIRSAADRVRPLILQGLFQPGVFSQDQFTLVSCFQTIEHLSDPVNVVREAWRVLKPGGAIFLIGHNRRALSARILGRRSPIFDIEHLQLFSPQSLQCLLHAAGFSRIRITPFLNRYPLSYWSQLFPLPGKMKRVTLTLLRASGAGRLVVPLPARNISAVAFK
jgi:SAM-dependent methyltransferase